MEQTREGDGIPSPADKTPQKQNGVLTPEQVDEAIKKAEKELGIKRSLKGVFQGWLERAPHVCPEC